LTFITSRNYSQLRDLNSLPKQQRNNPEVILISSRKHSETIGRQGRVGFSEFQLSMLKLMIAFLAAFGASIFVAYAICVPQSRNTQL